MISVAKARASIPGLAPITDDTVVADMIARAVAFVETYTRRYFGLPETVTEFLAGTCRYDLYLSERPQTLDSEAADVAVIERCTPSSTSAAVTAFQVRECDTYRALLHRIDGAVWGSGYEYAVTYIRGYLVDAGPKDIEQVLLDLVALKTNTRGREGIKSETIGGYSYTLGDFGNSEVDALPGAKSILNTWRRSVVV